MLIKPTPNPFKEGETHVEYCTNVLLSWPENVYIKS